MTSAPPESALPTEPTALTAGSSTTLSKQARRAIFDRSIQGAIVSLPRDRQHPLPTTSAIGVITQRPPNLVLACVSTLVKHNDERVLAALLDLAADQLHSDEVGAALRGRIIAEQVITEALTRALRAGFVWTALLSYAERLFPHVYHGNAGRWSMLDERLHRFVQEHDGPDLVERLAAFDSPRLRFALAANSAYVSTQLFSAMCDDLSIEPERTTVDAMFAASTHSLQREHYLTHHCTLPARHRPLLLDHVLDVGAALAPNDMRATVSAMELAIALSDGTHIVQPSALMDFVNRTASYVTAENRAPFAAALDRLALELSCRTIVVPAAEYEVICAIGTTACVAVNWIVT